MRITRRDLLKGLFGVAALAVLPALPIKRYTPLLAPVYLRDTLYRPNRFMVGTAYAEASNATGTVFLYEHTISFIQARVVSPNRS